MAAHGFKPLRHLTGGQVRTSDYLIAITYDTAIFTGDPVKLVANGGIELAAAGNIILGIFQGVSWTAGDGEVKFSRYWPGAQSGATNVSALVIDDPYVTYSAFDDGVSDFLTLADVGFSADHVAGTGSTATGISAAAIDTTTASATAAGFKIIRSITRPGNDYGAANGAQVEIEVMLNEPFFAHNTAGI